MKRHGIITVAALLLAVGSVQALNFTYTDATSTRSALASFSVVGGDLQIKLQNTYTGDTPDLAHVLTGIFFSGADGLTPVSAYVPKGSKEWIQTSGTVLSSKLSVGGNWQYKSGLTGLPGNGTAGISSTGLGIFGPNGNFGTPGSKLDGGAYGLVSAGYLGLAQDGLANLSGPVFQNSVIFTLSGLSAGFNINSITDVYFQYGTSLRESSAPSVPDGASTAALLGFALTGGSLLRRKLFKS